MVNRTWVGVKMSKYKAPRCLYMEESNQKRKTKYSKQVEQALATIPKDCSPIEEVVFKYQLGLRSDPMTTALASKQCCLLRVICYYYHGAVLETIIDTKPDSPYAEKELNFFTNPATKFLSLPREQWLKILTPSKMLEPVIADQYKKYLCLEPPTTEEECHAILHSLNNYELFGLWIILDNYGACDKPSPYEFI